MYYDLTQFCASIYMRVPLYKMQISEPYLSASDYINISPSNMATNHHYPGLCLLILTNAVVSAEYG
jgi:hypothetical protein